MDSNGVRAGRWPLGLFGMLAIVVAVESYIGRRPVDFTDSAAFAWVLSDKATEGEARGADVLCFGDSLAKHGLLPEVIERTLGVCSYNLATPAAPAPAHYYLLRHALDRGARPRAIVVDFMPGMLAGPPSYASRHWPELLTAGETFDLAREWGKLGLFVETSLARLLPSYRTRFEVRREVLADLDGRGGALRTTNLMLRRNWSLHRGAQFTQDNPAWDGRATEADHDKHRSDQFWCNPINRRYIDRFLALAGSHGIRAYWLLPPVSPEIQRRREESGADEKYTRFVAEVAAGHREVVVLDARESGYDHTRFVDPIHLTGKGALALSADVAEAIGSGRSAWVALPAYRDRNPTPPFENLEQSRAAVLAGQDALRR